MNKTITKHHILFIAIGGISLLLITEFAYFVGSIVQQFLILYKQNPLTTIIINELIRASIFIGSVYFILNKITKYKELSLEGLKKYLIWLIVLYFLVQGSQIVYNLYGLTTSENYTEGLEIYSKYIKENYFILVLTSVVYYLQLVLFAVIIVNYTIKHD